MNVTAREKIHSYVGWLF